MSIIKLIRNKKDLVSTLPGKSIIMNGLNDNFNFGGGHSDPEGRVIVDHFSKIYQGSSLADLKEIGENCNCIGALLAYDGSKYTIFNGNSSAADYWDPYKIIQEDGDPAPEEPPTTYGTVLAVCAGLGLWPIKDWYGMNATDISVTIGRSTSTVKQGFMCWAPKNSGLYNSLCRSCIKGTGLENTYHIFNNHGGEICNWNHAKIQDGQTFTNLDAYRAALTPLWEQLTKSQVTGIKDWQLDENGNVTQIGDLYIPNQHELGEIIWSCSDIYESSDLEEESQYFSYNSNIGSFLGFVPAYNYWSSSQNPDYFSAFYVNSSNGYVEGDDKDSYYLSIACIHFSSEISHPVPEAVSSN